MKSRYSILIILLMLFCLALSPLLVYFALNGSASPMDIRGSYTLGEDIDYTFESDGLTPIDLEFTETSNIRYRQERTGIYNGTQSFTGMEGESFISAGFSEQASYGEIQEIQDYEGHDSVMTIIGDFYYLWDDADVPDSGSFSLWTYMNETNRRYYFIIRTGIGGDIETGFDIYSGNLRIYSAGSTSIVCAYDFNQWNHISISWDIDTEDVQISYNGLIHDGYSSYAAGADPTIIYLTSGGSGDVIYGFDAFDIHNNYDYDWNNVPEQMEDTMYYEPDKWAFHQEDVNVLLDDDPTFDEGTLGWHKDNSGGEIGLYTGLFNDPEDGETTNNVGVSIDTTVASSQSYIQYDLGDDLEGYIELYGEVDKSPTTATGCYSAFYFFDSAWDTITTLMLFEDDIQVNMFDGDAEISTKTTLTSATIAYFNFSFHTDENIAYLSWTDDDETESKFTHPISTRLGFRYLRIASYSTTTTQTTFGFDNIGLYINGTSQTEEYGYGTYENSDMNNGNYYAVSYNGYYALDTKYPSGIDYNLEDTVDHIHPLWNADGSIWLPFNNQKDTLIFTLAGAMAPSLNQFKHQPDVWMEEDSNIYEGIIEYEGSGYIANGYFWAQDDQLFFDYDYDEGSYTSEWMSITFDIGEILTTNYTSKMINAFKTNWLYDLDITLNFTDGTAYQFSMSQGSPFDIYGTYYQQDFIAELIPLKYIDCLKINVSITEDTGDTTVIGGLEMFKLSYYQSSIIDLDNDLHDSGILDTIIPIILLIAPTLITTVGIESRSKGSGKKLFVPVLALFTIILFATGILPAWLFFIMIIVIGVMIFIIRRNRGAEE